MASPFRRWKWGTGATTGPRHPRQPVTQPDAEQANPQRRARLASSTTWDHALWFRSTQPIISTTALVGLSARSWVPGDVSTELRLQWRAVLLRGQLLPRRR